MSIKPIFIASLMKLLSLEIFCYTLGTLKIF
jgi:hypothetical protein